MKNNRIKKGKKTVSAASAAADRPREYMPGAAGEQNDIILIRAGFAYPQIRAIQHAYQLPDKTFAHLIGISDKTLARIKTSHAKLSSLSGDRLYRLKKVWALANKVLENRENALAWLSHAQPGLNHQAPLDILDTEPGYEQVQTLLNQLEFGVLP